MSEVGMIASFGISDVGPVRSNNEDCLLRDDELGLYVVADGMGGHAAGEVAARLAVGAIHEAVRRGGRAPQGPEPEPAPGPGPHGSLTASGRRLRSAIEAANARVYRAAQANAEYSGMGTTIVCALVEGARVSIGHVGDSRLYRLSNGILRAETQDDTWAAAMLANGDVDAPALAGHPLRNVLTNVLGAREPTDIHLTEGQMRSGDMLLLCTDGVHGVVDDRTLCELMSQPVTLEKIAQSLIAVAFERATRDNVSVVLVRYDN